MLESFDLNVERNGKRLLWFCMLGDDGVQQQTATKNPKPTMTCLDFACVVPAVCSERF